MNKPLVISLFALVLAGAALAIAILRHPTVTGTQVKDQSIELKDIAPAAQQVLLGPMGTLGTPTWKETRVSDQDIERIWNTALLLCGTLTPAERVQAESEMVKENVAAKAYNRELAKKLAAWAEAHKNSKGSKTRGYLSGPPITLFRTHRIRTVGLCGS
jgi:hypothetical protein